MLTAGKPKVLVIEGCDFEAFPIGGTLTTLKQLVSLFGDRLALVGVSTRTAAVGKWVKRNFGGVELDFFNLKCVDPTIRKPRVPRRLDILLQLKRYKRAILSLGLDAAFAISPEVMLGIRGWGLRVAYLSPGVENPLIMPRYKYGRWIAGPFERTFFSALARHTELIMAAADDKAIERWRARSRGLLADKRIICAPTLVDTTIFNVRRPGTRDASPVLVACGRLNLVKGWDLIFEAFLLVKQEIPSARLRYVGDGEDRAKLEQRVRASRLTDSILITGFVPPHEVAGTLNRSDLFLLGSHWEGWPTALVEAEACGLPAVATDVSGVSSLIQEGKNGYIVRDRDPRTFASAIHEALAIGTPNATSLQIAQRHSLESWKAMLAENWEPFR